MTKRAQSKTFWAVKDKKGNILPYTMDDTKSYALFRLFPYMTSEFQAKHWKNTRSASRAYTALGYRAIKVKMVEVKVQ
jgi:hypothetical protein